ncbi:hypothetical protein [[Clostridium] fimetarium]|uniref:Uncharacterized protein n=1 Tax=[Clostridium] fimetarium TaxID=99656 RepID=A0A1I0RDS5_9FIRM|nr:hypothetical protein [[Clostridium] fimetarium]SEW38948.1 hypothetical protein SAMN05421659_11467 [[Clostridium] fimetarium]
MAFYSFIINKNLNLPLYKTIVKSRVMKTEFPSQLVLPFHDYNVHLFYVECKSNKELISSLPELISSFILEHTSDICVYPYSDVYSTTAVNNI